MRTRMTSTAWFGPKRYSGWGWSPRSWQGWSATGVFVGLAIVSNLIWSGTALAIAMVVLVLALLAVAVVTGDPPGGPGL